MKENHACCMACRCLTFNQIFLFYNGPEPPEDVFKNFTDIKPFKDTCKTRTMRDLVQHNNWAVLKGSVYQIGTETVPLPGPERAPQFLGDIYQHWVDASDEVALVPGLIASMAFQPAPKALARVARSKGGDLLDLDEDHDRLVVEFNYSFTFNSSSEDVDAAMRDTFGGVGDLVRHYTEAGDLPGDAYLPLFSNDAFYSQDYWGRLRPEKTALARRVQQELDPKGMFKKRTGGWKL